MYRVPFDLEMRRMPIAEDRAECVKSGNNLPALYNSNERRTMHEQSVIASNLKDFCSFSRLPFHYIAGYGRMPLMGAKDKSRSVVLGSSFVSGRRPLFLLLHVH